jgi:hypothetical protein
MLQHLTDLQSSVKQVCDEAGIHSLLASKWAKLEIIGKTITSNRSITEPQHS